MGRKHLNKIIHIAAQVTVAPKTYLGCAGFEQVTGVERYQIAVYHLIEGHARHYAYAQAKAHIGLNNIGIGSGKNYSGMQALGIEGLIQFRPSGEAEGVGDNRIFSYIT